MNETVKIKYIRALAVNLKRNFFAGYLTANIGLGIFAINVSFAMYFLFTSPLKIFPILIGGVSVLSIFLLCAYWRLSAKKWVVRIAALVISILCLGLTFFYLGMAAAFLGFHDIMHPSSSARMFLVLVMVPIFLYYMGKIFIASITTWKPSYARLANIYIKNPSIRPRVFNLIPRHYVGSNKLLKAIGLLCALFSILIIGLGNIAFIIVPFTSVSDVLPLDANVNFRQPTPPNSGLTQEQLDLMMTSQYATQIALLFILIPLAVMLTSPIRSLAYKIFRLDAESNSNKYVNKPIVYLRAFGDDKLKMKERSTSLTKFITQSYYIKKLDELLAEYLWGFGPVIAVQDPNASNVTSNKGPILQKFDNDKWRSGVQQHLDTSILIVLQMNMTDGVQWEFEKCLEDGNLKKTLFFFGLQSVEKRKEIFNFFCEKNAITIKGKTGISANAIAAFFVNEEWTFLVSPHRGKFDYLAALMEAIDTLGLSITEDKLQT